MSVLKYIALASTAAMVLGGVPAISAQVSINIGRAPICPYGYFDYAPYNCSPYGYYGPDWFNGGIFIGAGPWYRGNRGFYGHVDNRYDPRHGYNGPFPDRDSRPFQHFRGNEARDGQGHYGDPGHDARGEHEGGYQGYRGGGDQRNDYGNGNNRGNDHGNDHGGDHHR